MESVEFTETEIALCKSFLQKFSKSSTQDGGENGVASINNNDKFESFCFCITKAEVNGEIIDVLHRYLYHKECPSILVSPLVHYVEKKFRQVDLSGFELEKINNDENELIEYNAANIVKELYKIFQSCCQEFLQDWDSFTVKKSPQPCHVCVHAVRNRRRKMEDRHVYYVDLNNLFGLDEVPFGQSLFGVFDGHGGTDAAHYAASQLVYNLKMNANLLDDPTTAVTEAIMKTDKDFCAKGKRERLRSGATVVLALIQGTSLTIAWLGDSQIALCKAGKTLQLVDPHKPDRNDERERIKALGGCVVYFGGWRVNGSLAVSRAIGDYEQKPFVSGVPDVETYEMEGDEDFLILACDGLWDNVELNDAVRLVCRCVEEGDRDSAAVKLVELAKEQRSMDNISVVVVYFDFNGAPSLSECSSQQQTEHLEAQNGESQPDDNGVDNCENADVETATLSDESHVTIKDNYTSLENKGTSVANHLDHSDVTTTNNISNELPAASSSSSSPDLQKSNEALHDDVTNSMQGNSSEQNGVEVTLAAADENEEDSYVTDAVIIEVPPL